MKMHPKRTAMSSQCSDLCELGVALMLTNLVTGIVILLRKQWQRRRDNDVKAPIAAARRQCSYILMLIKLVTGIVILPGNSGSVGETMMQRRP